MGVGSLRLNISIRDQVNSIFLPLQTQNFSQNFFFMIIQWLHHLWNCIYIPGRYISEVLSDTSGKEALSRYI